ncbi:YlzJ-like family protein [Neobacillus sp. PS3-34]|uniref:YlzJ-like family protein n=1 Tax=Neobacillus sp. PS3-34 TaxID=3070678 RepID=UPI0027E1F41B|nr:YlzJ-like family protein [Neobacillus sp. PS3-34]WML49235.1 YlzJ-like family protein [Neobacillus sp. PS3-34]
MILYTIVPPEQIFPTDMSAYGKVQTVTYQGIPLLVEVDEEQTARVMRVMSSDPQHYLDERCCPGTKISLAFLEGLSS